MELKKHAYCIIAHNEPKVLSTLIELIDDERNDIFVFVDKKATLSQFSSIKTKKSGLHFFHEKKVYWSDYSQIVAELYIFKKAFEHGRYSYFHLLSGVDLPLKSQNFIHNFLEDKDYIFLGFCKDESSYRIKYRYYFTKFFRVRYFGPYFEKLSFLLVDLQKKWKKERFIDFEVKKGTNWCSLTYESLEYLISKEDEIKEIYKHSYCADEVFIHTILWNSQFKEKLFPGETEFDQCKREIDWNRGTPYVWKYEDLDILRSSKQFFARKISSCDERLIKAIVQIVKEN